MDPAARGRKHPRPPGGGGGKGSRCGMPPPAGGGDVGMPSKEDPDNGAGAGAGAGAETDNGTEAANEGEADGGAASSASLPLPPPPPPPARLEADRRRVLEAIRSRGARKLPLVGGGQHSPPHSPPQRQKERQKKRLRLGPRRRTLLHRYLVGGDAYEAWNRIHSHPEELFVMDGNGHTPLDYALTFDVPPELLWILLRAQRPLGSGTVNMHTSPTESVLLVANGAGDGPKPSHLYNDRGQLPLHRAFLNNAPVRTQRTVLLHNPELCLAETLTDGQLRRIEAAKRAGGGGAGGYRSPGVGPPGEVAAEMNAWSPAMLRGDLEPRRGYRLMTAASGPRCDLHHVRDGADARSTPLDLAWKCPLERAGLARLAFLELTRAAEFTGCGSADPIACTLGIPEPDPPPHTVRMGSLPYNKRAALALLWARIDLILRMAHRHYFAVGAPGADAVAASATALDIAAAAAAAAVSGGGRCNPVARSLSLLAPSGKSVPNANSDSPPSIVRMSHSDAMDDDTKGGPRIGSDAPPSPPLLWTYYTAPDTELVHLEPPKGYPCLHTALRVPSVPIEVIKFVLRMFPNEVGEADPNTGELPIHVVAVGRCAPRRWGWLADADADADADAGAGADADTAADGDESGRSDSDGIRDGDTSEERWLRVERRRGEMLIPLLLLSDGGRGAKAQDGEGRLPLHLALEAGHKFHRQARDGSGDGMVKEWVWYHTGVANLLDAYPQSIGIRDPKTGLYPFMTAASTFGSPEDDVAGLSTVFELLLQRPDVIMAGNK